MQAIYRKDILNIKIASPTGESQKRQLLWWGVQERARNEVTEYSNLLCLQTWHLQSFVNKVFTRERHLTAWLIRERSGASPADPR